MKTSSIVLLCWLASLTVSAQEVLSLKSVPFYTSTSDLYVAEVIDQRPDKHLGKQKIQGAQTVTAYLHQGAAQSVMDFYNLSLSGEPGSKPIYIQLKALNVQESKRRMNQGIARIARAHVSMVFLEEQAGALVEVFRISHNEDEVFGLYDRKGLFASHERRIRAALEYCMQAYLANQHSPADSAMAGHFKAPKRGFKAENKLWRWVDLVTVKGMQSNYFGGYGISYTGFADSKNGWIRPYETSFEVTWSRPGVAEENGFTDVNAFVFRPELYFLYKRLFNGVYLSLSGNIPVGFELLENLDGDNSINFVVGAGLSQGIRIIPWENRGFVFGADFFQQFETSRVYRTDLGVELVLGVNL